MDFILQKNLPKWEKVTLNPKLFVPGTIYRCSQCHTEILVPYGRSIYSYDHCTNCNTQLVYE